MIRNPSRYRSSVIARIGLAGAFITFCLAASTLAKDLLPDRDGTQWSPYTEWSLENATREGNPFDLLATATFVHEGSDEKRTTGMFYAGGDTWKFRFTGTRTGRWTFVTSSDDADLNDWRGAVTIRPNPDDDVPGFVAASGDKWIRTGTGRAFVPQLVMYAEPKEFHGKPEKIDADIRTFLVEHGFNGFHVMGGCYWFDIDTLSSRDIRAPDPNPDPRTFEALELLITKTHAAGGMVHIWAWGDESRGWTPTRWGKNGRVDRRLLERLRKEAVHELGHAWGLVHCGNAECAMGRSPGVAEIDAKGEDLCVDCRLLYEDARRRMR